MSKGNEEERALSSEGQDSEPETDQRLSRGKFIAAAGVAGAGLVVGSTPAMAKSWTKGARNKALTARGLKKSPLRTRSRIVSVAFISNGGRPVMML